MAITRAQIAKQLLAKGGRIGLANGSRMDSGEAREARGEKSDFGGKGDNTRTRIQDERQRDFQQQQLRELSKRQAEDKAEEAVEVFRSRNRGGASNKVLNFLNSHNLIALVEKVKECRFHIHGFTFEDITRVITWDKQGITVEGLSKRDLNKIIEKL